MRKGITGVLLALALTIGAGSRAQYDRDYFYYVGRSFMIDNNFEDAIRTLNILLRFDDDAYEGYFLRGIAKYNLDDLLGAEADFTTAIEKNPVFTTAFTYRAITRSRLGNYDDALSDFAEAIELRPRPAQRLLQPGRHAAAEPAVPRSDRRLRQIHPAGEQGFGRLSQPRRLLPLPQKIRRRPTPISKRRSAPTARIR